ncbi:RHS repeat-associated core domain-containing protein [Leptospira langatensis]|uniref:RHS repeat-associated core domain-containing protein n=1 Tax=Leptospira langatensis TaxID=2484983 RepID=A0A5F1ZQB1_9LEPT|nr:RHS repeat-associated core domain-containing protein [Leptospira langatensis]TGK02795.1 RHS repeat-associated core domain-containing protein [Leptospira langatensis]TGL40000.1 RHS repeat-associated core domain-containing protein [Leptospira langatensis]
MSGSEPEVARPAEAGSPKSNAGPWNLIPSALENTTAIGSKSSSSSIDGSGVPAVGGFFYQTDRLGSTSMLTDGNGNPVSGPGRSGTSYVGYLPYGEMNNTESSGPDIFRYKFTGQILDEDTGLYYYKSRYYDPFLARFIQADDRANQGINGLNRYMYVGGNPTNSIDPNGHVNLSQAIHMFNRIVGHILGKNFHNGNSPSFQSIGHDLSHSLLGKGLAQVGRWILRIPTLLLDSQILFLDSQFGTLYNLVTGKGLPQYSFKHGAVLVTNSGLGNLFHDFPVLNNGGGLTPGPVVFMYKKPGDWFGHMEWNATLKHEYGHVDEFYSMNGIDFFGRILRRPSQRNGTPFLESHADHLAGTDLYGSNVLVEQIFGAIVRNDPSLAFIFGIYSDIITEQNIWEYLPLFL